MRIAIIEFIRSDMSIERRRWSIASVVRPARLSQQATL